MRRTVAGVSIVVVCFILLAVCGETNSDSEAAQQPATVLKSTTRMVVLDVIATDRHGNPVTDLKADDFKVLEEGHAQKIRAFSFEQPATSQAMANTASSAPKLPPNTFSNVKFAEPPKTLNVILLDLLNTNISRQMFVRQQTMQYLEKMPADQPVAVYVLTQRLQLLHDFTSDTKVLKAAIEKLRGSTSAVLDRPTGGQEDDPLMAKGAAAFASGGTLSALQSADEHLAEGRMQRRVGISVAVLKAMARTLAGYPGRKNLIWVGEGFPFRAFSARNMRRNDGSVATAVDALSDAQVAVYPVDTGMVTVGMDATTAGEDKFRRSQAGGPASGMVLREQQDSVTQSHFTMQEIALGTGGEAFFDRNELDAAIQSGMTDGSTYYVIGYYPADKNWDGKFRKIEVKVERPGTTLRHRVGYFATDRTRDRRDAKMREVEVADALSLANPPATALSFTAALTLPSPQMGGKLVVKYDVDAHSILFEPGDDGSQHADVTCWVRAFNEKGEPLKATSQTSAASLKSETYQQVMKTAFPCSAEMELPVGKYVMRFAVRDERTGLMGTANGEVTIAGAEVAKVSDAITVKQEITQPLPKVEMETSGEVKKSTPPTVLALIPEIQLKKISPAEYCRKIAVGELAPLANPCEMVMSVRSKLPDFVCDQKTVRRRPEDVEGRASVKRTSDVVSAEVRYIDGEESYSNITLNGKPTESMIESTGMSTVGEFATMLRNIFDPDTAATFTVERRDGGRLIVQFQVDADHTKWFIQSDNKTVGMGYHGRLWLEESNGKIMRVEQVADTPLVSKHVVAVEYEDVKLGERGAFRLPSRSSATLCVSRSLYQAPTCFDNTVTFTNYRKFSVNHVIGDTSVEQP